MNAKTKIIFIVYQNTDLTEGRGHQVPIAYCEKEATAKRLAKGKGVMGSNADYQQYESVNYGAGWLAPYVLQPISKEDVLEQARIDTRRAAIEKAKSAGLSDADLKDLGVSS